jgi:hypothetical protein
MDCLIANPYGTGAAHRTVQEFSISTPTAAEAITRWCHVFRL